MINLKHESWNLRGIRFQEHDHPERRNRLPSTNETYAFVHGFCAAGWWLRMYLYLTILFCQVACNYFCALRFHYNIWLRCCSNAFIAQVNTILKHMSSICVTRLVKLFIHSFQMWCAHTGEGLTNSLCSNCFGNPIAEFDANFLSVFSCCFYSCVSVIFDHHIVSHYR